MDWAAVTNRIDRWTEMRAASHAAAGGISSLVPGMSATEPPDDFEAWEEYVSPRVPRVLSRYS
jgi:hypothetical protein